jgi:hypothetical protein
LEVGEDENFLAAAGADVGTIMEAWLGIRLRWFWPVACDNSGSSMRQCSDEKTRNEPKFKTAGCCKES